MGYLFTITLLLILIGWENCMGVSSRVLIIHSTLRNWSGARLNFDECLRNICVWFHKWVFNRKFKSKVQNPQKEKEGWVSNCDLKLLRITFNYSILGPKTCPANFLIMKSTLINVAFAMFFVLPWLSMTFTTDTFLNYHSKPVNIKISQ